MDFVVTGPSASGKTTIVERSLQEVTGVHLVRTCTTRAQKPGEGDKYRFLSEDRFQRMVADDEFEEYADVHGNWYGVPKSELNHEHLLFEIDCQGAETIKRKRPNVRRIYILPPSLEVTQKRLESRNRDSPEEIARRLSNAAHEIRCAGEFDCWIVNDDLERTVKRFQGILLFFLLKGTGIPAPYRDRKVLEQVQSTFLAQPA